MGHFPAGGGGGGSGTISEIESTDHSVTITDPTGPTVDLSVPAGGGTISEITSDDDSVTITDPTGPTVDLSVSGGGGGVGQVLSLVYNGADPADFPCWGVPTGWDSTAIATLGAQITVGTNIASGVLEDTNGNPLPDGYTFPATLFVEDATIFDIVAFGAYASSPNGGWLAWGTSGGPASQVLFSSQGFYVVTPAATGEGINFNDYGDGGVNLASGGVGPVLLQQNGTGSITIETSGGGVTTGLLLTTQVSDTAGIVLTDNSTAGIGVNGATNISITTFATAGPAPQGIILATDPTDLGGLQISDEGVAGVEITSNGSGPIQITDNGGSGIELTLNAGGNIIMTGVPSADPSVAGALWNDNGLVVFSGSSPAIWSDESGVAEWSGPIATTPTDSHTATTGFGSLTVGTPKQNTLGYDIVVAVSIPVTVATGGAVSSGVSSSATPTADPVTAPLTLGIGATTVVNFSQYVPSGYYINVTVPGTLTVGTPVVQVTPV